ncbi:histidine kinase [Bradyrhizobium sp. LHD-71]|uniref:type III secretion apparatus assembly chaperone SctY n=1 Tax=Bradyrhizobium sp. LHD-71 TaxID=3072141 RepID=UPI00280FDE89|nr:histidine kinase [Bradyrhizobium sp. LHD-71]MDQ8726893.1 histidine kinase [Bradyrhizobium sp. LHD-71]
MRDVMRKPEPAGDPSSHGADAIGMDQRDLLCALAYVYVACGQCRRALPLLRLVVRARPDDVEAVRLMAYAHLANNDGAAALAAVDRLDVLDTDEASQAPRLLLRSQALRLQGQMVDARRQFDRFVAVRTHGGHE